MKTSTTKAQIRVNVSWIIILIIAIIFVVPFQYYSTEKQTILINPITYRFRFCDYSSKEILKGCASRLRDSKNSEYVFTLLYSVDCSEFHFGLFEAEWWKAVLYGLSYEQE